MQVKRLISRRIRKAGRGFDLAADVNAVVSVNAQEDRHAATSRTGTQSPRPFGTDDPGPDETDRGRENA